MKNYQNYKRGYYMPPVQCTDWVNKEYIDKAPISVSYTHLTLPTIRLV